MIRNILTSQWIQQLSSAVLCPLKFQIFLQRCNFKQISYDLLTQIFWNFPPLPTVSKEPIFPFPTELKRLAEKKLVAISNMIRLLLARKQSSNKFVEIRRNLFLTFRKFTKIDPCVLSSFTRDAIFTASSHQSRFTPPFYLVYVNFSHIILHNAAKRESRKERVSKLSYFVVRTLPLVSATFHFLVSYKLKYLSSGISRIDTGNENQISVVSKRRLLNHAWCNIQL